MADAQAKKRMSSVKNRLRRLDIGTTVPESQTYDELMFGDATDAGLDSENSVLQMLSARMDANSRVRSFDDLKALSTPTSPSGCVLRASSSADFAQLLSSLPDADARSSKETSSSASNEIRTTERLSTNFQELQEDDEAAASK
jgi:hypothetical protein